MSGNAQKTPFLSSITRLLAEAPEAAQQVLGRAPPASILEVVGNTNTIVKVKVEVDDLYTWPPITCPVVGPEFVRYPLTPGIKGFLLPSDYYLGGMSGLGGGTARLTRQTNLSSLVFFPIGNANFSEAEDKTKYIAYGDTGVILRDKDNVIRFVLDKDLGLQIVWNNQILMAFNANGISIQYQGKGINILADGTRVDGVNFLPHTHDGVQPGAGDTGPVVT